jgi:hypothetical protein
MLLLHQSNKLLSLEKNTKKGPLAIRVFFMGAYLNEKTPNYLKVKGFCGPDGRHDVRCNMLKTKLL